MLASYPFFGSAEQLKARANKLAEEQHYEAALVHYTRYLAAYPQDLDVLARRARLFAHLNRPREALADYKQILAREPAHPLAGTESQRLKQVLWQREVQKLEQAEKLPSQLR